MSDVSGGQQTKLRESISALIDGEADELELRRVLANADTQEVRNIWRDYHLQRDVLAGVSMQFAHIDISQRIQAVLTDEVLPAAVGGARWWRPFASVAVAASVAAVVVVGTRSLNSVGSDNAVAQSTVSAAGFVPVFATPSVSSVAVGAALASSPGMVQTVALDPDQFARQRLQQYLQRHIERAALNNSQGVISFSKVSEFSNE